MRVSSVGGTMADGMARREDGGGWMKGIMCVVVDQTCWMDDMCGGVVKWMVADGGGGRKGFQKSPPNFAPASCFHTYWQAENNHKNQLFSHPNNALPAQKHRKKTAAHFLQLQPA